MKTRRLLLKISGEALSLAGQGLDEESLFSLAQRIIELHKLGHQIALVLGGGNILRGVSETTRLSIERTHADQMGMLATIINGLSLLSAFQKLKVKAEIFSAVECSGMVRAFEWDKAIFALENGSIVILVGGTGHPYFTTDTAAALRASELKADLFLKATTRVDGIYNRDPLLFKDAKKYDRITYRDILEQKLGILDLTAVSLCMANSIPIRVFNFKSTSLLDAVSDKNIGTLVSGE